MPHELPPGVEIEDAGTPLGRFQRLNFDSGFNLSVVGGEVEIDGTGGGGSGAAEDVTVDDGGFTILVGDDAQEVFDSADDTLQDHEDRITQAEADIVTLDGRVDAHDSSLAATFIVTALTANLANEVQVGDILLPEDVVGNRPAAGTEGRIYWATDTGLAYRDTGAVWTTLPTPPASAIAFAPNGSIAATNVQAAIQEVRDEAQPLDTDLSTIAGLVDPNADRILFWDDSAGAYVYLAPDDSSIEISGTTLRVKAGGITNAMLADTDLSTIGNLTPSNDDIIQRKSGAWANRTLAQYRTDLNYESVTVRSTDADYTILNTDRTVLVTATFTATRTFTLPAANTVPAGYHIDIVDVGGSLTSVNGGITLIIDGNGSETINGALTVTMDQPLGVRRIVSNGSNAWHLLASKVVDKQSFTASGTWRKPAGAIKSYVFVVAAGGAGGGGFRNAAGNLRNGGLGGAAGGVSEGWFQASDLGSTETVTVATTQTSVGTGSPTDAAAASAGTAGGDSVFGGATRDTGHLSAGGGQGGAAATAAAIPATNIGGTGTNFSTFITFGVNIFGAPYGGSNTIIDGGDGRLGGCPGGGAAGAWINAGNTRAVGGTGGFGGLGNNAGGAALAATTSSNGNNGTSASHAFEVGGGGGGGGNNPSGAGGNGGNGGAPGGGGGGGGGSTGGAGGNGGQGGRGQVTVYTICERTN